VANIVLISRHDYRTRRRASVHFIAEAMARKGHHVRFISIGYSFLSKFRKDSRCELDSRSNKWEAVDDVQCYLWKTPWHPFDAGLGVLRRLGGYLYDIWANTPCQAIDESAAWADAIIVESGIGPILLKRLDKMRSTALMIYKSSDLLATAKVHPRIQVVLDRDIRLLDHIIVVARSMRPHFAKATCPIHFIPHGIDTDIFAQPSESPYARSKNIVSVGSMLFDNQAVAAAASAYPDYQFHLIGCRASGDFPSNVIQYDEMPFEKTVRYLQHADVGLAVYADMPDGRYLVDSSMKLMQFGHIGLPAVTPHFAVGDVPLRFGYDPLVPSTIVDALAQAMRYVPQEEVVSASSWDEQTGEILKIVIQNRS
jgi:2-beta-glucuronyltransferase